MNPLKIVIAVHHFPPTFKGGAEWRAHRTATWLQNQGHRVKVICVEAIDDPNTLGLRWVDEEFDSLSVRRLFLNLANAPDPEKYEYDNLWIEGHLSQYLAENPPDIFHLISGYLMTAGAIKAAKKYHVPLVATLTDFWFLCPRHTLQRTSGQICYSNTPLDCVRCQYELQRRYRLPAQKAPTLTNLAWQWAQSLPHVSAKVANINKRQKVLQDALAMVDGAICPSNFLKYTYLDKGFQAKEMRFMRQGLKHVPPQPPKKIASNKLRIGYIGSIAAHKGVHILVEAFLKLNSPNACLELYGDTAQFPDFYQELQAKTAHDKRIRFMGMFDNHLISQIHAKLDVLVVPSTWYENSPNTILEAFAHLTPVITSNLGGMAELVADGQTGLLFAPNNATDLAQKLQVIADQPALLKQWQGNIQPIKTLEVEMAELWQIYQHCLNHDLRD